MVTDEQILSLLSKQRNSPSANPVPPDEQIMHLLGQYRAVTPRTESTRAFFEALRDIAFFEMGFGTGSEVQHSGEIRALHAVRSALEHRNAENLTIFDVGANAGGFLKAAVPIFKGLKVAYHCFEPSNAAFSALSQYAASAGLDQAKLYNVGLGADTTPRQMFNIGPGKPLSSLYQRRLNHFGVDMKPAEEVQMNTVDNVCQQNGIEQIDLLKIDVEGHEFECLQGAKGLLSSNKIPFIQFKFGGTNIDAKTFFQDFWYALSQYNLFRITLNGLQMIRQYSEKDEVFVTTHYLAQHKSLTPRLA